jgi:hypothetical protein
MKKFKIYHYCLILSALVLGTKTSTVCAQNLLEEQEIAAKNFINIVTKTEAAYLFELNKFSDNFSALQITTPNNSYKYKLNLFDNGRLAQTVATPTRSTGLRTYTGALSFNNGNLNSIICGSEKSAKAIAGQIKLVNGQLNCPAGFKIIFHQVQQEASNSVGVINRAQQAYSFETRSFTQNKQELGIYLSETYYNYSIDLLENGKLAQTVATPKYSNLKSYIGGIYYFNDTGKFSSIVCASEQPAQNISQSIQLVDGKLNCPTGFNIVYGDVQREALNTVGAINRVQQAHQVETTKFAKNLNEIELTGGFTPSETHYTYSIDLLENGKLAQTVATPKYSNLKSYIGGIYYFNDTGKFSSIVCASEQPTQNIPQSITLVDGKINCPAGFNIIYGDVQR